jgi:hypothetical protein
VCDHSVFVDGGDVLDRDRFFSNVIHSHKDWIGICVWVKNEGVCQEPHPPQSSCGGDGVNGFTG